MQVKVLYIVLLV